jgi:hypothetical protein
MHQERNLPAPKAPKEVSMRSIAHEWHLQFQDTYAHDPDEITPEQEAAFESEAQAIDDELHCVGDGPHFTRQIMVAGDGFCLHLFPEDASCFGCGCGKPELWCDDVLRIVGSEETLLAINPNCANWLKAAKQRMEEFDNWRLMHTRCASDVAQ